MANSALSSIKKVAGTEFQTLHVREEQAQGVDGGAFTGGSWQTRVLNTTVLNEIPGAGLSANQMTLPAGTYSAEMSAPAYRVDQHKIRFYDITHAVVLKEGTSEQSSNAFNTQTRSIVHIEFTLTEPTVLEVQHRCLTTRTLNGFGVNSIAAGAEVYAEVVITRETSALSVANIEPANLSALIRATFENVEIKQLTNSTISIESARVGSDDGAIILEINSPITLNLAANGENALDTGSEAVSTWYYTYAIRNPTTGSVKGLISASATNPTLPAGFTQKGLIGQFYNHSDGNIPEYIQHDLEVWHTNGSYVVLSSGAATAQTLVELSVPVPPNAVTARVLLIATSNGVLTGHQLARVSSTATGSLVAARAWYRRAGAGDFISDTVESEVPLLTEQSIWYWNSNTAGGTFIWISGYRFKR